MKKKYVSVHHVLNVLLPLLLIATVYEYANSQPEKDANTLVLPSEGCFASWQPAETKRLRTWPKYVYNKTYGWFDTTHFNTGKPRQLIADVRTAVLNHGGTITITQDLHGGITGYTARYRVTGNVQPGQINGVALGIYSDWSWRFENWQGSPPRNIVNPFTPFAVEDLPSQYVGFFAAARNLSYKQVFACYLGGAKIAPDDPPDLVVQNEPGGEGLLPNVSRLKNESFEPLVETVSGWQRRPWNLAMRLTAVPDGPETWFFMDDETWYFAE